MFGTREIAIVPPSTLSTRYFDDPDERSLALWVRGLLVGMTAGLVVVFSIALWLDPYQADGSPRRLATHRQLGLPPCTFVEVTGFPCPACGMTTSFSLLVHADPIGSLRANWVGTLLASFCLLFIPWAVVTVWRGRPLFIRSLEHGFLAVVISTMTLMFTRWAFVVGLIWLRGNG